MLKGGKMLIRKLMM